MLSPLRPLLCRHDFYWSERHGADRCRRCGKRRAADSVNVLTGEAMAVAVPESRVASSALQLGALPAFRPVDAVFIDFETSQEQPVVRSPTLMRPSAKALKAQAEERRESLPELLEQLAEGSRLTREQAIDVVLAVIEDAHSADPVVFGAGAAKQFARLHEARLAPGY
jgi:hypothetical protein